MKDRNHLHAILLCLLFSLLCSMGVSAGDVYYVFVDKQGKTRIQDTLSPELQEFGYRVVNSQGVTLQVIPSIKDKYMDKVDQAELKRKKDERRLIERNRRRDRALLETFTSVREIKAAQARKLDSLNSIVTITLANIGAFEKILDKMKIQAEKYLNAREDVPEKLQLDTATVLKQIQDGRDFVQRKREEQHEIEFQYAQDILRFETLVGDTYR